MMRIGCVSDVCLGYGSPQIGSLVRSLSRQYAAGHLLVEPNQPDLPPRHAQAGLSVVRARNTFRTYSESGRVEYLLEAARIMDDYDPDILVVCCTFTLPVVFKLRRRPDFVIYYSYESIPFYGEMDMEMNRHLDGKVDLVVFPEENRAVLEVQRFGFRGVPKLVMYNCAEANGSAGEDARLRERNGRLLYSGAIHRTRTMGEYYASPAARGYPIDLYGPIKGETEESQKRFLKQLQGAVRYRGRVDGEKMRALRKEYAYSLVIWNPSTENQLYAAPNKFFESIADGVPPITAPHPQCKLLLKRYRCGLTMNDWSFPSFCKAIDTALELYGTDEWREMVRNCQSAFQRELNWDAQFEKLKAHLGSHVN